MKNILYSIIFLISLLFYSCTQDVDVNILPAQWPYAGYYQPGQTNGNGQFVIGGYVDGQYQSRVLASKSFLTRAAVSATYNDQFSLYAWTKDSTVMNGYHGIFNVTNNNATWGYTENVKYFDNFVDNYNFIGVIPQGNHTYNNGTVTVNAQSFTEDNATYDDREVLYASTTVAKANYSTGASLSFNHLNSKVFIKFTSDDANTEILDYSPYTPEVPYQPAVPGTQTTSTKSGKALDMLYAGEIVYWPYAADANLTSTQANNFYKNTSNHGNMGDLMDVVNAQFVYYNTSGSVTTNAWPEGNKKDMYGIQLAPSTNKDDFVGGTTEDTWKDAFWTNASTQIKDVFRPSYAAGWRVIRIEHIAGTQYDAWLLNNTEMTYKVITTTGGTPEVPYQPATGKPGIIMLPATSANQTGTDAVLATYPSDVNIELSLNDPVWTINSISNTVTFTKPTGKVSTSQVASPTKWFTFPSSVANTSNLGYTIKFSYKYKGVTVYDARVFIPTNKCTWEAGKYYTYIINIKGRGNGHDNVVDPEGDDPRIEQIANYEITINQVNIIDYIEGAEYEINVQ